MTFKIIFWIIKHSIAEATSLNYQNSLCKSHTGSWVIDPILHLLYILIPFLRQTRQSLLQFSGFDSHHYHPLVCSQHKMKGLKWDSFKAAPVSLRGHPDWFCENKSNVLDFFVCFVFNFTTTRVKSQVSTLREKINN